MKKFKVFRGVFDKIFFGVFDTDLGEWNLLLEDGYALLQEDGHLIKI